jgi:hypothetical protein
MPIQLKDIMPWPQADGGARGSGCRASSQGVIPRAHEACAVEDKQPDTRLAKPLDEHAKAPLF